MNYDMRTPQAASLLHLSGVQVPLSLLSKKPHKQRIPQEKSRVYAVFRCSAVSFFKQSARYFERYFMTFYVTNYDIKKGTLAGAPACVFIFLAD